MSVRAMGKVWDLKIPPADKLVLLAMVDHADDQGNHIHPGVELICSKTGYSDRQVRRIIASLVKQQLLRPVSDGAGGRGRVTEYQATFLTSKTLSKRQGKQHENPPQTTPSNPDNLTGNSQQNPDILSASNPDNLTGNEAQNPDKRDTKTLTNATQNPDKRDSAYRKNHHEPSCEPSLTARARAHAREGGGSFYPLEICTEYARTLPDIRTPVAFAKSIWRDGSADSEIEAWLGRGRHSETREERLARIFGE